MAVQALHENASPVIHTEPGGQLDTTDCEIRAVSDRATRVTGIRWTPQTYTIKLGGAEKVGYSAITFAGTRDPGLVETIDTFLDSVRASIALKVGSFDVRPEDYQLVFRLYGKNGVMGAWEPKRETASHEIGILAEVIAQSQEIANAVVAVTRASLLHTDFAGRMCKEGNMAFPFSPSDIERGPIYQFSLRHVLEPNDPCEMFPIEYETL